jgi:hypothetical protein
MSVSRPSATQADCAASQKRKNRLIQGGFF